MARNRLCALLAGTIIAAAPTVDARFVGLTVDPAQPMTLEVAFQNCVPSRCGALTVLFVRHGRLDVADDVPELTPGDSGNAEQIRGALTIPRGVERILFRVSVEANGPAAFFTLRQGDITFFNRVVVTGFNGNLGLDEEFVLNVARQR